MSTTPNRIILWVGEKHSGKTTSVTKLVTIARVEGFDVAGILAPSLYHNGRLMGFDVLDLRNERRVPLARRRMVPGIYPFTFIDDGVTLGNAALRQEVEESADLIIVDEFGPLELRGQGWRSSIDFLLASMSTTLLLVVRRELVSSVQQVYANCRCWNVNVADPNSHNKIIGMMGRRRRLLWGTT